MAEEIRKRVADFNDMIDQLGIPYKLDIVDPATLLAAPKNARFMTGQTFNQLVSNIKKDRALSSVPFCWRDSENQDHILSGHHRIEAAVKAGLQWIMILYTDANLSKEERIAVQLSHNALSGEDEPTLLRELWDEIYNVDLKAYSGLDDQVLKSYDPVKIDSLGEENVVLREVVLTFFPSELARVQDVLDRLGKRQRTRYAGPLALYDRFVDTLMDFKEAAGIYNSGTAFMALLDVADEWLLEQANDQEADLNKDEMEVSVGEAEEPETTTG